MKIHTMKPYIIGLILVIAYIAALVFFARECAMHYDEHDLRYYKSGQIGNM